MTTQRFDPRTDAEPVLRTGWLHPGERLVWNRHTSIVTFEVPGRGGNGKVLKQSSWRTAGRQAMAVADGAFTVLDLFAGDVANDPARPAVRVFGTNIDCQAAKLAEAHRPGSVWVLTGHRFALVRFDAAESTPHTEWELPTGHFGYTEFTQKRVSYERFGFADGSLIDFRR